MILIVVIVINGSLVVTLSLEELTYKVGGLLEVALAICRRMIRTREPSFELGGVWSVIRPATGPASCSGEIVGVWIPVEPKRVTNERRSSEYIDGRYSRAIDRRSSANQASSEDSDVLEGKSGEVEKQNFKQEIPLHHQKGLESVNMDSKIGRAHV